MKMKYSFFIIVLSIVTMYSSSFAQDNTQVGLPEGAIARLGKGGINIMRFSPDGTYLAVGTDVGVWLYDVPDEKETALFTGHTGHVNALAFSQDGNMLASGGFNNPIIQVWDIETKSKLSTLTLTQEPNSLDALTFYGRTLISIDGLDDISYWQIDTGNKLLQSSIDILYEVVVFSQDGNNLAIADRNGKIHLWDTTTSSPQATLKGHKNDNNTDIRSLAFSPDGKILASGSEDKTVKLWDTQNHVELGTLHGHLGWVTAITFSEDGNMLASGDANKTIKLWDVETRKARATITGHKNTINALAFAPVGTPRYGMCLASGSADGTIRFWNPLNGKELATFTTGHTEWIKAVAFSENGTTLTSAAFNGTVDVWSLKTWQELTTFTDTHCDIVETVALSPNGRFFASQGSIGMVMFNPAGFGARFSGGGPENFQIWNLATGEKLSFLQQKINIESSAAAFSPDNNILAVCGHEKIKGWHLNSGIELFQLDTKKLMFRGKLVFSPDGKKLAVTNFHRNSQVWDIATQRDITLPNAEEVNALAFSPDSSILAIVSKDGIYLWKFSDEFIEIPAKLHGFRNVLTFSPDGSILVGSGMEGWSTPIKLWDVKTGKSMGILSGHTESVEALVFSHDGKILASGSEDGTVLLWDWEKISAKRKAEIK
ncbi:hypothetical protein C6501_11250 [Candidatus Poribacteria bacterium]|nr:MAG: hypothetical protein C6501_11250 [Candidatus Poribacteria bacterium]